MRKHKNIPGHYYFINIKNRIPNIAKNTNIPHIVRNISMDVMTTDIFW
jgi:hypothetical protein